MARNHDIMLDESPLRAIFMNQESLNRAKYSWSSAEFSCCRGSAEEEAAGVHAYSPVVVGVAVVFRRSIEWMMRVCRLMTPARTARGCRDGFRKRLRAYIRPRI